SIITTKYCMAASFPKIGTMSSRKFRKSEDGARSLAGQWPAAAFRRGQGRYFAPFEALRARAAALARIRAICPRGRGAQISPIHSSFTALIGLALKLVRLTELGALPRSIVFR